MTLRRTIQKRVIFRVLERSKIEKYSFQMTKIEIVLIL